MNSSRSGNGKSHGFLSQPLSPRADHAQVLDDRSFQRMISLERKRSERSRKPFLLMLLDAGDSQFPAQRQQVLRHVVSALSETTRETDVLGWYKEGSMIGVMFTEIVGEDRSFIVSVVTSRVTTTLRSRLTLEEARQISITFHLFPEDWGQESQRPELETLYPDLLERDQGRKLVSVVKRAMDIVGSVAALVAFSPLFLAIAAAVKLSSPGPVFFRQKRIGQHGVPFVFLKFRSMRMGSHSGIHKDYVVKLIAGQAERKPGNGRAEGIYKLTDDPRITRVGAFLRRTSMDELPQFVNVLKGEMSLVGPRPPIPYEVEAYDIWHRRRVLEAKPGITGLWQVTGRSRVKFDDMVRLDLQYARTWSPWMDIKILLRTPGAMFDEGAC